MSFLYEAVACPANADFFEKIIKERSDCKHSEDVCQDCRLILADFCKKRIKEEEDLAQYNRLFLSYILAKRKKEEKEEYSACKHAEDVCQDCLEKVQTTTEDSPTKDSLSFGSKLILFPVVSSFLAASGALWVINTKAIYTAAKMALKLIATPSE